MRNICIPAAMTKRLRLGPIWDPKSQEILPLLGEEQGKGGRLLGVLTEGEVYNKTGIMSRILATGVLSLNAQNQSFHSLCCCRSPANLLKNSDTLSGRLLVWAVTR